MLQGFGLGVACLLLPVSAAQAAPDPGAARHEQRARPESPRAPQQDRVRDRSAETTPMVVGEQHRPGYFKRNARWLVPSSTALGTLSLGFGLLPAAGAGLAGYVATRMALPKHEGQHLETGAHRDREHAQQDGSIADEAHLVPTRRIVGRFVKSTILISGVIALAMAAHTLGLSALVATPSLLLAQLELGTPLLVGGALAAAYTGIKTRREQDRLDDAANTAALQAPHDEPADEAKQAPSEPQTSKAALKALITSLKDDQPRLQLLEQSLEGLAPAR